jgi:tRNA threonylcarbamoyladenosine biosynthesis protein TsaB
MLLAIESATEVGGVALFDGGRLVAEIVLGRDEPYNAALLPAVDRLLAEGSCPLNAITVIALSIGPGSFTGLRVGLSTALGLCFGTGRRIVPVPTLAALSLRAEGAERVAPLLDARKGQVYAGLYGPRGEALAEDRVVDPIPWLESLRGSGPLVLLGPGARLYLNEIRSVLGEDARVLPEAAGWPRAATVGLLGSRMRAEGGAVDPRSVELRYLRKAEAEERAGG